MWETMKNSDVCAFFTGDLLTVIDREGHVRLADWADRDRQSVPEQERLCSEALPKTAVHEVLPVGDEVWVLTANPHGKAARRQMQLVRLDRDLQELRRQDLYPLDEYLDYVYTGLYRNHTPHHLLTPTHYFRTSFVPQSETGTRPGWELENGAPCLYLFWRDLSSGVWEEWALDIADIAGDLPGGEEDSLDSFQGIEVVLARENRLFLLAELNLRPWGYCHALLEADVAAYSCRILWASEKNNPDNNGGEPRILDLERGIQWTFAYPGEADSPKEGTPFTGFLPLVARRLEPGAPVLEGEPVWRDFPYAWPEDLLAWDGKIWMQNRGVAFWSQRPTGETSGNWRIVQEEGAVCEGLWQGQLIFRFPNGALAALPPQGEEPDATAIPYLYVPQGV